MADASATAAAAANEYTSYWAIVWEQYRKNRTASFALWMIVALFATAIYAPMFSSKLPFIWADESGTTFPWFRALLFNRNVYANGIDLFFNLLLVLTPVFVGARIYVGAAGKKLSTRLQSRLWSRTLGSLSLLVLSAFVLLLFMDPRSLVPEYRELIVEGDRGWGVFPPIRIQADDTLHGLGDLPGLHSPLGRDDAGRDVLVRLLYGTRVSLSVGVIAVSIYITLGTILGALGGFFGGRIDLMVQRLLEIFLCFPTFFMILTFIGFMPQPSITWVMIIIGFLGWTGPARLVRGEFLRLRNIDFVAAAKACGLSDARIIFRHILPNAIGPVLVNATFGVASAVLVESSLSFLGLGDPTMPSWGRILAYGRASSDTAMMLIAGGAIFVTVSVFNLAGEGFRDALDPKLRR
jgi:peptide/nickel transport system permease protein